MFRRYWKLWLILLLALALDVWPRVAVHALSHPATTSCGWDLNPGWVSRENAKPGNALWAQGIPIQYSGDYRMGRTLFGASRWQRRPLFAKGVRGWLDSVSATCGQSVGLHINSETALVSVRVFRMGYYGGDGARLISSGQVHVLPQDSLPKISSAPESTVSTNWSTAFQFRVDGSTPPGQYLIRLDDGLGQSTFAPLTIYDPELTSAVTFVSSVLTWQAYNCWGGYSLYKGPHRSKHARATVASFDRPYDGDGSGQFRYLEYPIVKLAEHLGIDMNYITDVELDRNLASLRRTKSILLGGHAEYWTNGMRDALQNAVSSGVNLASLGANAGYNRPRLQANNRQLVMWRLGGKDAYRSDSNMATMPWRDRPILKPESLLLGAQYVALGVNGDYKITHPKRWPFSGMKRSGRLYGVVGREVDSPLYAAGPAVEVLALSPIHVDGQSRTSMATYYTNAKGAGVLDISTNGWTCAIDNVCPWSTPHSDQTQQDLRIITEAILQGLAKGPLGLWRPAIIDIPSRLS